MRAKSSAHLAVWVLVLPVTVACGFFGGDPSPTPAPELISAIILTPTPTAPGTGDRPEERTFDPTPQPTYTPEPTPTPQPTYTPVPTSTPEPTATPQPTATATPEPTATATPEPTATATPEPTATATPEPTATATTEPTATSTPEPTATATPEPTATATPEPTATATPEPTATATSEPTATAVPEPTATAVPEPTATSAPVATPVPLPRGSDALLKAINDRNVQLVETLLAAGFPVDVSDEDGNPFLYIAIVRGRNAFFRSDKADSQRIVQILVDAGTDVNVRNATYGNPVLYSSFSWSSDVVQILVDAGADVNARTASGETLLLEAVRLSGSAFFSSDKARFARIVKILLDAGADDTTGTPEPTPTALPTATSVPTDTRTTVTLLTDNDAIDHIPDWSPDGRPIAFYSDRDGDPDIYGMNADGSGARASLTMAHRT